MVATDAVARPGPLAALRVPDFRRLIAAVLVSGVGTFVHTVAASWLMLELTGSPFMVGLVAASQHLPRLIVSIPAGALADAVDRRRLLIVTQSVNATLAIGLAALTATGRLTPVLLVTFTALIGTFAAAGMPAYQTLMPDLLPRDLLAAGVAVNSATMNLSRAAGPLIGGLLVAAGRADLAFALNGISYVAIVVVLALLRGGRGRADRPERVWRGVVTGLRYARHTPALIAILTVTSLFALSAASVQTLLPNVAADELGLGAGGYGGLLAAFGIGAAIGALFRGRVARLMPARLMVPFAVTGTGLVGVAFAAVPVPLVSALVLALSGAFWVWTHTTMNVTIQLMTPQWVRGRAMSLYSMAFLGVTPLGALLAGGVAEPLGAAPAVLILSSTTVLLGLVTTRLRLPTVGDVREQAMPEDWIVPPHAERVIGSPVLVATTWTIDPADVPEFFALAKELRRHRFRTGAIRWHLFRNVEAPDRMTEVFEVHDWEDHLRQHTRVDAEAAAVIRKAREFDRGDGPTSQHLVGIDLLDHTGPPSWEALIAEHEELHAIEEPPKRRKRRK